MAPTIVLKDGKPLLAVGSPGGSTIITTVLQILMNRLDLGMTLPEAIAAPRATQRNTPQTLAEQAFIDRYGAALQAKGQDLALFPGPPRGRDRRGHRPGVPAAAARSRPSPSRSAATAAARSSSSPRNDARPPRAVPARVMRAGAELRPRARNVTERSSR